MELIQPGLGLVFWTAITFIILLIILRKFAWKPILGSISEREDGIRESLESAEKARREMENLQADNERILKEARAEREAMLKEARELKTKMIEDAKFEAKEEGQKMIEQARSAFVAEKNAAMSNLKKEMADLTVSIAEKVVQRELSDKDNQLQLVDTMLKDAQLN